MTSVTAPFLWSPHNPLMEYVIYRELDNKELVRIATRETLADAEHLVKCLRELWPAIYPIRPAEKKAETN